MKTIIYPYVVITSYVSSTITQSQGVWRTLNTPFFKTIGGDMSYYPLYRDAEAIYMDVYGNPIEDLLKYLGAAGFNTIKCRLYVAPSKEESYDCQDLEYVVRFAKEIKGRGFDFLLDLHYSDRWSDEQSQVKPNCWDELLSDELPIQIYDYTRNVLERLRREEVMPDFVQLGNEVSYGLLWDDARVSTGSSEYNNSRQWIQFAEVLKAASAAVRDVCEEDCRIILHSGRTADAGSALEFYRNLLKLNVDFDIIGLSYLPFWHGTLEQVDATVESLAHHFGAKEILFVEVAYPYHPAGFPVNSPYTQIYPASPDGQAHFLRDFITRIARHPQVTGFLYWFPEESYSPNRVVHPPLHRGLFNNKSGHALPALEVVKSLKIKR